MKNIALFVLAFVAFVLFSPPEEASSAPNRSKAELIQKVLSAGPQRLQENAAVAPVDGGPTVSSATSPCDTTGHAGAPAFYWKLPEPSTPPVATEYAMRFSADEPETLKAVSFFAYDPGDGSFGNDTFFVKIYDDNMGLPGTLLSTKAIPPGSYSAWPATTRTGLLVYHGTGNEFHVGISTSTAVGSGRFESILSDDGTTGTGRSSAYIASENQWVPVADEDDDFNFVINVEVCRKFIPSAKLCGTKFDDLDCDGVQDPGEPGIPNWPINLYKAGVLIATVMTGPNGEYCFNNYAAGPYHVVEGVQTGWVQTLPTGVFHNVTLTYGQVINNLNFGNCRDTCELGLVSIDSVIAGTRDNFVGIEAASPSNADLGSILSSCAYPRGFDEVGPNKCFGHTFRGFWDSTCCILDGTLCLKLRAENDIPVNDWLYIVENGVVVWGIQLRVLHGHWNAGDVIDTCLSLENLPPYLGVTNVLATLRDGDFSVYIQDDTEVDYLQLKVKTCCKGRICGTKYESRDCEGKIYPKGVPGWPIQLYSAGSLIKQTVTGANGEYCFTNLNAGTYQVSEASQTGWVQLSPSSVYHTVVVGAGQAVYGTDFVNYSDSCRGATSAITTVNEVHGTKDDFAGIETSFMGPDLAASLAGCGVLGFDQSAADKCFGHTFTRFWDSTCCLVRATLCVRLVATNGGCENDRLYFYENGAAIWAIDIGKLLGLATNGVDSTWNLGDSLTYCLHLDSLPASGNGITNVMAALQDGDLDIAVQDDTGVDWLQLFVDICCKNVNDCSICGTKFFDANKNGLKDGNDAGLAGWKIYLYNFNGPLYATTTTDANGNYCFYNLPCVSYTVTEEVRPGWVQTSPSPSSYNFSIAPHGNVTGMNFNNYKCDSLSDTCCVRPPKNMVLWLALDEATGTTALNSAGGNNGVWHNNPTVVNEYVKRGLCFNGSNQWVDVKSYPAIFGSGDPGTGSFTLDAWVKRTGTSDQDGVRCIVDKRLDSVGMIWGYSLYLYNGRIGFQIADGPGGYNNYGSPQLVPRDGRWHHVAVTVCRAPGTPMGQFFYDGLPVMGPGGSFTPNHPLSISNSAPFRVGGRTALTPNTAIFIGCIDEVEMFRRCLKSQEIYDIWKAKMAGKCKSYCRLPWNSLFCLNDNTIVVKGQICNTAPYPQTFNYSFQGLSWCQIPGPTMFAPSSGSITIPAGQCAPVSVTITRPAGLTGTLVACYQMAVNNPSTGETFACTGSVRATPKWCLHFVSPLLSGPVGTPVQAGPISVTNTGGVLANESQNPMGTLNYQISVIDDEMLTDVSAVRLNGLPPGTPVIGTLSLAPGGTTTIDLTAEFVEDDPLNHYTIVVEADTDGDGVPEPLGSMSLSNFIAPTACCIGFTGNTDGSNDDVVDISDVFAVVDYLGASIPLSTCDTENDVNVDGVVDISDLFALIDYLSGAAGLPNCP